MFGEVVPISYRDRFLGLGRAEEHALLFEVFIDDCQLWVGLKTKCPGVLRSMLCSDCANA